MIKQEREGGKKARERYITFKRERERGRKKERERERELCKTRYKFEILICLHHEIDILHFSRENFVHGKIFFLSIHELHL